MTGGRARGGSGVTTLTAEGAGIGGTAGGPVPGLLLAWTPPGTLADDRPAVGAELTVGRGSSCDWCIPDDLLSRTHFAAGSSGGRVLVADRGSRNGTFVDGVRLTAPREVTAGAVLRAGGCVFVVAADLRAVAPPGARPLFGIAGPFHADGIARRLRLAARSGRHVLLEGETGTGKELAARAVHELLGAAGRGGALVAHNAARFAGEDNAVTTLFGVARGAFTGVEARAGALETAGGGTLFLDEVHNLPARVQRALLRLAEDGMLQRVGEPAGRRVDVRLVLGTNAAVDDAVADGRLAHDLVARLHRVTLPPLRERRADVPGIFRHVLLAVAGPGLADAVASHLEATVVERLCRHDFRRGNVRELQDLAARIAARIVEGEAPRPAIAAAIDEVLGPAAPQDGLPPGAGEEPSGLAARLRGGPGGVEPRSGGLPPGAGEEPSGFKPHGLGPPGDPDAVSPYERHRAEIVAAWREADGNLSRLEQTLRARGLKLNRRWLAVFLDRWGVRAGRRRDPAAE
jgi:DNA-binding NtrC family response regulator